MGIYSSQSQEGVSDRTSVIEWMTSQSSIKRQVKIEVLCIHRDLSGDT